MTNFLELLPELKNDPFFKEMYLSNKKLDSYAPEMIRDFVYYILGRMAQQSGGYSFFWKEGEKDFLFEGWVKGLSTMLPREIFAVLWLVLRGQTQFSPNPPRTPLEFKHLCHTDPFFGRPDCDLIRYIGIDSRLKLENSYRPEEAVMRGENTISEIKDLLKVVRITA